MTDAADGPADPADPVDGTFLVTAVDANAAVLSAVDGGRVHPIAGDAGLEVGEVVEATLTPDDPLGVTWRLTAVRARFRPVIEAVDAPPAERAMDAAPSVPGRLVRIEADGDELHVLAVDPERTEAAVEDVLADETTRRIAARLGAHHVEVRGADGVVAIRYRRGVDD